MVDDIRQTFDVHWQDFIASERLQAKQATQFMRYKELLLDWNERMNLTAITDQREILAYHFQDSLAISHAVDLKNFHMMADVGSGAGFPGIPLSIAFPHLSVLLIEVNQKKIRFLKAVIEQLSLPNVTVIELDWLTFLRKTHYKIDIFCARASLKPEDLIHAFDKSGTYAKSAVVYWASNSWKPSSVLVPFIQREFLYTVGEKARKLIFLQACKKGKNVA